MPSIDITFENINIHLHKVEVIRVNGQTKYNPPYSWVGQDMAVIGRPRERNLMGTILLQFFNFGQDINLSLVLYGIGIVKASENTKSADTFCKLLKYLFIWMNDYVEKNEIKDKNEKPFIVPEFLYSKENFEGVFPG
jgi:hypothetical protein